MDAGVMQGVAGSAGGRTAFEIIFDAQYYVRQNRDVAQSGLSPRAHFLVSVGAGAANPCALFDVAHYLAQSPEVAESGLNPLLHYVLAGGRLGLSVSPLFDAKWYLTKNPDIADNARLNPLAHYLEQGAAAGREANPLFDHAWYLRRYPEAGGEASCPLAHFAEFCVSRRLSPHPLFDSAFYLDNNPDVAVSGVNPLAHYLQSGWREGRDPSPTFSTANYLTNHPDVARSGENPLVHFVLNSRRVAQAPPSSPAKETVTARFLSQSPGSAPRPVDVPYYGTTLHRLVEAARARTKPLGTGSKAYEAIRAEFDIPYYLVRYPDIAKAARLDVLDHYLTYGAKEGRDPSPDFSTSSYVGRYPDVVESGLNPFEHWLTIGRREGRIALPFADFDYMCSMLGRKPVEVQELLTTRRRSLRERFEHGELGRMVAKAAEIEPLIAHSWPEALAPKQPPFHSDLVVSMVTAMHRLHTEAGFRRTKAVVVIPHCRLSGATRIAGHLANALAEIYGIEELVIVRTDLSDLKFPDWFPRGCRHVDFAGVVEKVDKSAYERLLAEFLRSLRPQVAFNVNSRLMWDATRTYGKALSATMALYAYLFCNDRTFLGYSTGYPLQKFYRHFDLLSGVITDNRVLAEELRDRHLVPPDQHRKLITLETPIATLPEPVPAPPASSKRRPTVFWAGRFDRQKRVDIVYALAARMPDVEFRLWGEAVLDKDNVTSGKLPNISLQGVYDDLDGLPWTECDAWLYTSEWDGVPNMLIEVAARGVPLVGSIAGGTTEILDRNLSWPIAIEDIVGYESAIREVLANPVAARAKALRLRGAILTRRTCENYRFALSQFLGGNLAPPHE